jgi:S1-C subfamily serine protease
MKKQCDELDEKIKKAVSQMERPEPTSCPDEEALVCYLEGRLGERERDEIEGHLADCSRCCDQVIAMNRVIHAEKEAPPASEEAIQKAMDLVPERPLGTLEPSEEKEKESIMSSEAIALKTRVSWKPFGYGIAAAAICVLLIFMVPYFLNIPVLGLGKFGSPLELSLNVTGKITGITERGAGGEPSMVTIEEGDVLKSHDGFQIRFKTNRDAYAYVVLYSHRGEAQLLFPHPEIRMSNKIEGDKSYTLPSKDLWFTLDENIGMETVFVLASKRPISHIETVIDSLKNKNINEVKKILAKKAAAVKAISFRHIDDKPLEQSGSFDTSFENAMDEVSIKSSPYHKKIEAHEDLIQPLLSAARQNKAVEEKLVLTFDQIVEKRFLEKTRGAGSSVYKTASPAVVFVCTDIGAGAGALYKSDYVITNWHVVRGKEKALVIYKSSQGIEVKKENAVVAEVIKVDEVADLALLRITKPRKNVTPLPLGDIARVEVGQEVHAIGHPEGEVWTYTKGTVSQIRPNYEWTYEDGSKHKSKVIQTQTPINPGNSGGPLLDDKAHIIGINSFGKRGQGLNYAISVDEIQTFLSRKGGRKAERLIKTVEIAKGFKAKHSKVVDEDKNGIPEVILLDMDGDGKWDVAIVDKNQDGTPDHYAIDTNKNNVPDRFLKDMDGDGFPETHLIDNNEDGKIDLVGIDTNKDFEIDKYVRG